MGELETIVDALEDGEQTLEQSLAQFERGIALVRFCQQSLSDADRKISILLEDNADEQEDSELQPFDPEQDSTR